MADDVAAGSVLSCEVCIAGGGPAGITLARELGREGKSVILVESGSFDPDPDTQALYAAGSSGAPYDPLATRLRYLGGSTNHWSGWCRPIDPLHFEPRPWFANSGWPLRRTDLDPYYERAASVCELAITEFGPDPVPDRRASWFTPLLDDGTITSAEYRFSPPTRFGSRYRDNLDRSPEITAILGANLVNIADKRGRVARFDVATLDGNTFSVEADAFVIALGGIESARMLLASRDSNPAGLGNDRDLVGRYFMDHYDQTMGTMLLDSPIDGGYQAGRLDQRRAAITLTPEAQRDHELGGIAFVVESFPFWIPDGADLRTVRANDAADVLRGLAGGTSVPYSLQMRAEQEPNPESRVTLTTEVDGLGVPVADVHWVITTRDRERIARGLALLGDSLGTALAGLARAAVPDLVAERRPLRYGAHHMGTTRMSDDAATGVVDRDCRVHGIENLWVAGSSVFPACGYVNPTLTIVALTLRLADHLRSRLS